MREILFRGKLAINNIWQYSRCPDGTLHSGVVKYDFIPETVGQFTGLTDKNGKKIFTGDIISADNGKQSCVAVVKFGEYYPKMFYKMLQMFSPGKWEVPACGFFAESVDKHEEMILFQSPCVTVIGNIHDNPELLEG